MRYQRRCSARRRWHLCLYQHQQGKSLLNCDHSILSILTENEATDSRHWNRHKQRTGSGAINHLLRGPVVLLADLCVRSKGYVVTKDTKITSITRTCPNTVSVKRNPHPTAAIPRIASLYTAFQRSSRFLVVRPYTIPSSGPIIGCSSTFNHHAKPVTV
jgi:hypothetical protein